MKMDVSSFHPPSSPHHAQAPAGSSEEFVNRMGPLSSAEMSRWGLEGRRKTQMERDKQPGRPCGWALRSNYPESSGEALAGAGGALELGRERTKCPFLGTLEEQEFSHRVGVGVILTGGLLKGKLKAGHTGLGAQGSGEEGPSEGLGRARSQVLLK